MADRRAGDAVHDRIEPAKIRHGIHLGPLEGYVKSERLARNRAKNRLVTDRAVVDKELFQIRAVSSCHFISFVDTYDQIAHG